MNCYQFLTKKAPFWTQIIPERCTENIVICPLFWYNIYGRRYYIGITKVQYNENWEGANFLFLFKNNIIQTERVIQSKFSLMLKRHVAKILQTCFLYGIFYVGVMQYVWSFLTNLEWLSVKKQKSQQDLEWKKKKHGDRS